MGSRNDHVGVPKNPSLLFFGGGKDAFEEDNAAGDRPFYITNSNMIALVMIA